MRLIVHVHPGSTAPGVGGLYGEHLIVRVRERAIGGQATNATVRAVAAAFDVPTRLVTCVRGTTSRTKHLEIEGDGAILAAKLTTLCQLG